MAAVTLSKSMVSSNYGYLNYTFGTFDISPVFSKSIDFYLKGSYPVRWHGASALSALQGDAPSSAGG